MGEESRKKRESGTFLEQLCAKHWFLPKSRGRRAEWVRVGPQSRSTRLTIWHCPLNFVSWGSARPLGASFLSNKIEAVVEIK